jgi:hypothetical protein
MRFDVDLHRQEWRTVTVEAADRDEAERLARAQNAGFSAEGATEMGADGEPIREHLVHSRCDACSRAIWQGQRYAASEDRTECDACADSDALRA